jgi:hypothetical protein
MTRARQLEVLQFNLIFRKPAATIVNAQLALNELIDGLQPLSAYRQTLRELRSALAGAWWRSIAAAGECVICICVCVMNLLRRCVVNAARARRCRRHDAAHTAQSLVERDSTSSVARAIARQQRRPHCGLRQTLAACARAIVVGVATHSRWQGGVSVHCCVLICVRARACVCVCVCVCSVGRSEIV